MTYVFIIEDSLRDPNTNRLVESHRFEHVILEIPSSLLGYVLLEYKYKYSELLVACVSIHSMAVRCHDTILYCTLHWSTRLVLNLASRLCPLSQPQQDLSFIMYGCIRVLFCTGTCIVLGQYGRLCMYRILYIIVVVHDSSTSVPVQSCRVYQVYL